jgi:hypothetical protein
MPPFQNEHRFTKNRPGRVQWMIVCIAALALAGSCMFAAETPATPGNAKPLEDPARKLFAEHCEKCHSGPKHKGDFQIESLSADFADRRNLEQWLTVLDQLKSGDMPPEEKPRPPAHDVQAVVEWISGRVGPELARRAAEGRVVLRRLNRAEYANTVRDLLGVDVDLSDLLPPDTSTSGFDNSAEALHTSSYLLRNYLDAADRVLDEAIANKPQPWQIKKKFDIKDEKSVKPKGSVYRHTDDGVAIFASWESANIRVSMWNFRSHVRGKYRFRISGYAYQTDKPVNFHVNAGTFKEVTEERLIDYFAFPPDKPTVVEFTEQLEPDNHLRIVADGLPALPPAVEKVGADKYTGPGLVIQWVEVEGPLMASWPPPSHAAIFGDLKQAVVPGPSDPKRLEVVSQESIVDAGRILRDFARRAFRRPVTDEDIKPFLARVEAKLEQKYSFEQAMRVGLRAVLVSPSFLFLREKVNAADAPAVQAVALTPARAKALDDYALASRLSYFLWSSMPDEELLKLAEAHKLRDASVLDQQVERMLSDPKAKSFTENFTGQWLSLRAIDATTPDRALYPEYDDILKMAMVKETVLFFDEVLKNDLSLTNFVASDFTFVNARLAKHYGIPGIEGTEMRKVTLPPDIHRGGVLTMGSVMKVTANGTTTSPVLRGAWVLERILGTPPPKPPADVEAIEPDIRGATTIREQLAKHRNDATCASCHSKIDPPGFALESFDVIGGWRDHYRATGEPKEVNGRKVRMWQGPGVDPADVTPDGRKFRDIDEYKKLLLEDKDQLAAALTEKLLTYSTGAAPAKADKPQIKAIVAKAREKNYGFKSLIHEVVQSPMFQSK